MLGEIVFSPLEMVLNRSRVDLTPFEGPAVITVFFGSWCGPCVSEFPSLISYARENGKSSVVLVAEDDTEAAVSVFLGSFGDVGRNLPVVYDVDKSLANHFGVTRLPESFVMKNGRVCDRLVGEQDWSSKTVRDRVNQAFLGSEVCR